MCNWNAIMFENQPAATYFIRITIAINYNNLQYSISAIAKALMGTLVETLLCVGF